MDMDIVEILSDNFMPHGHCFYWKPEVLYPQLISNALIAIAYCCIPVCLTHIYRKRTDIKFLWIMILFAIFILGCGLTHVLDIILVWNPVYHLDTTIRVITALASIGTALVLIKITPSIITIPTTEKWKKLHQEVKQQEFKIKEKDDIIAFKQDFEFLVEFMPHLVWTADSNGNFTFFNKKWYDYTGMDFIENVEKCSDLIHPEDFEYSRGIWDTSIENNIPMEMEIRLKGKNGEYRWFLIKASSMVGSDGKVIKWFGTSTDIHERKLKREELIRINNDLDNFVYTASHDLKSPISNMEGLLNIIDKQIVNRDIELDTTIGFLKKSISKLRSTIDDLTNVAKIQKGNEEAEPLNVENLFNEIYSQIKTEGLIDDSAKIDVEFKDNDINFSKPNLRSVIYNLVSNAFKYKSSIPVEVKVKGYKEGIFYIFSVQDNGLGIPEEQQSKIFKMFKRYYNHISGTGVGLYIVKRIAENSGGKVILESEKGKGSIFTVYLKCQSSC